MKGNKIYPLLLKLVIASLLVYTDADVQEIVQLIKNGMDNVTNPCDNYYQHVCGLWKLQTREIDFFQSAREKMDPIAKDILQQPESDTDSNKLLMEKKWYNVCRNQNISSANGFKRIKEIYESSLRFKKWTEISLHYTRIFGQSIFFDIELNKEHIIKVVKPSKLSRMLTTVPDERFDKFVHEKIQFLDIYFTPEEQHLENKLIVLLKAYRQVVSEMIHESNILSIRKIQKEFNNLEAYESMADINWLNYFNAMGVDLNKDDPIETEFRLSFLDAIISIIFPEEPRIQAKFFHIMYIMNDDFIMYWNQLLPSLPNNILCTKCFKEMPIKMGVVQEIIQNYLKEKVSFFKRVYKNVYETLETEIKNSRLTEDHKISTLEQLRNIEFQLPGIYGNRKHLMADEINYEFNITSCGLQNLINFNKAQLKFKVEKYRQQHDSNQFSNTSLVRRTKRDLHLTSSYSKKHNKLEIVAEHLLTNLFSNDAPIAWNYGHLAFFIGHELSHVLDNIHSPDNDVIDYSIGDHLKCYFKHANKFGPFQIRSSIKEVLRAQRQMMREIVADSVGLKIAYKTFKQLMKGQEQVKNRRLPDFNDLNENKLFFTSFATQFCQQPLRHYKNLDTHLPNDIRVIMAVENLQEFSTTFNCHEDSFTEPLERCDLLE